MPSNHKTLHPKKRGFLAALSVCGSISKAAERAGVDRSRHYAWKREDPEYKAAFDQAYEEAGDALEDMLASEAIDNKNITAAIFLLKGIKKEKYRDRVDQRHSSDPENPLLDLDSVRAFLERP